MKPRNARGENGTTPRHGVVRRNLRTIARMEDVVRIMVKYGFSETMRALRIGRGAARVKALLAHRDRPPARPERSRWELLRGALEELGPTFVKLGQLLGTRSDILPADLVAELSRLQDSVAGEPWPAVKRVLSSELGRPIAQVFREIDEQPTASASIAQVHHAILSRGEEVAVKIQRPGIAATIEADLAVLDHLARLAERHLRTLRHIHPTRLVGEFRRHILRELDFVRERRNMERFRANHAGRRGIHVPVTYRQYSTSRLLVMEFVHGVRVSVAGEPETRQRLPDYDPSVVARRGADLMLEQILVHGFFHADPHPGNVMILPGNVVCYLDFGMMGTLRESERELIASAVLGIARRDGQRVADALTRLGGQRQSGRPDTVADEVQDLLDDYLDRSLGEMDIGGVLSALVQLIARHGIDLPPDLLMVAKALLITEGVGETLYPEFTLEPAVRSVARKVMIEHLRPGRFARLGSKTTIDYLELLRDLPGDARDVLGQLRSGQLMVGFRMRGLEPLRHTLDSIGYRLIFGLVLAALMISSALIIGAQLPPLWHGISLIGVAGFAIAGLLGIGFLITLMSRVFHHDR